MKKFVLCISLLSSVFCAVGMAQATDNLLNIVGLEPTTDGTVTYYLKNVGTGLYMSYGGEHGAHCIESQQAHPLIVEENGDYVAIASLGGYLESNTLWMDWAKSSLPVPVSPRISTLASVLAYLLAKISRCCIWGSFTRIS